MFPFQRQQQTEYIQQLQKSVEKLTTDHENVTLRMDGILREVCHSLPLPVVSSSLSLSLFLFLSLLSLSLSLLSLSLSLLFLSLFHSLSLPLSLSLSLFFSLSLSLFLSFSLFSLFSPSYLNADCCILNIRHLIVCLEARSL